MRPGRRDEGGRLVRGRSMPDYDFFLSYARDDLNNDPFNTIAELHKALVEEIRLRRPREPARIGFFDTQNIAQGDAWPRELGDALRGCRAFVPVVSPTYF